MLTHCWHTARPSLVAAWTSNEKGPVSGAFQDGRVHPHALRHSLASALAMEGKPLPTITAQLGHSSTAVTDRYLAKIAPADLVIQIRDRGRL